MDTQSISISPFMDENAVAEQLGTTPLNVRRVAAKGFLKAAFVGSRFELRVTASQLQSYVESGMPGMDNIPNYDGNFIEDYFLVNHSMWFERDFKRVAQEQLDALRTYPVDNSLEPVFSNRLQLSKELIAVCNSPLPPPFVRIQGENYDSPLRNRLEAYVIVNLRNEAEKLLAPTAEDNMVGLSRVGKFFLSHDAYMDVLAKAWKRFLNRRIEVSRHFQVHGDGDLNAKKFTWKVYHRDFKFDKSRIEKYAF